MWESQEISFLNLSWNLILGFGTSPSLNPEQYIKPLRYYIVGHEPDRTQHGRCTLHRQCSKVK